MSHLTRTPFHKPSPFDLPRPAHPLSPPDTDIAAESLLPPMNLLSRDSGSYVGLATSSYTKVDPAETQTSGGRFRRTSNLAYLHHGSLRSDSRSAPRSATRWLVMVVPPPPVSREHGYNVFLNASARAAHAVLMPLLPSLSGQLSAIAREFSFPSTSGICVYLQMAEAGIQFTPRVSDESWSILWGSAFDERQVTHSMGGLPIAGRIEFDLDLRKARWFDMWVTACRRELNTGPSAPVTVAQHRCEDSRTTFTQEPPEDSITDISVTIQQKVPVIRYAPRKLSLLDRVDVSSLELTTRAAPRPLLLSPTHAAQASVEAGEDEPQTAMKRLEKKVQTWRASSSFAKSPLVSSTGQTALDPTNMPNNLPLDSDPDIGVDGTLTLNLDDFTWSISSAGPPSPELEPDHAPYPSSDRAPSVHLDARLEGSVCLTPTTCTSFGPPDYEILSPMSSVYRLPSPDIAARNIDYAPLTPSTATSWGPPSEWPSSPASSYHALSVDLAARQMGSRPATPSTATSWGAPAEWPASPATPFYVHTPGVGNMFFDKEDEEEALLRPGRVLQSHGAGGQEPWRHVSPRNVDVEESSRPLPWKFVWPYRRAAELETARQPVSTLLDPGYPYISPYPAVYPSFDLYPACCDVGRTDDAQPWKRIGPYNVEDEKPQMGLPWNHVWSYQHITRSEDIACCVSVHLEPVYPSIIPYPAVYPHFDLYTACRNILGNDDGSHVRPYNADGEGPNTNVPRNHVRPYQHVQIDEDAIRPVITRLRPVYPLFSLYPPVYPHFDLYLVKPEVSGKSREVSVKVDFKYPTFSIYAAVYPSFEIYPGLVISPQENPTKALSLKLPVLYPSLEIYPPVYPHLVIYLEKVGPEEQVQRVHCQLQQKRQSKAILSLTRRDDLAVNLGHHYPFCDLYSVVDSAGPIGLYPAIERNTEDSPKPLSPPPERTISNACETQYSNFDTYPAVYPYIYRSGKATTPQYWREPRSVKLEARYPALYIYPPVYPSFDLYNTRTVSDPVPLTNKLSVHLENNYPFLDIYPAVYPHFQIYQAIQPVMQTFSPRRRTQKTHRELHDLVFSQSMNVTSSSSETLDGNQRRSHEELHDAAFLETLTPFHASVSLSDVPENVDVADTSVVLTQPGVPAQSSNIRRSLSLGRASKALSFNSSSRISRGGSLRQLPTVAEGSDRAVQSSRRVDYIGSNNEFMSRNSSLRDSIVLEKARHWGSLGLKPVPPQADPSRLTMDDLSGFPMPPLPPLPGQPPTPRAGSTTNHPVAKLDRSKFPFH